MYFKNLWKTKKCGKSLCKFLGSCYFQIDILIESRFLWETRKLLPFIHSRRQLLKVMLQWFSVHTQSSCRSGNFSDFRAYKHQFPLTEKLAFRNCAILYNEFSYIKALVFQFKARNTGIVCLSPNSDHIKEIACFFYDYSDVTKNNMLVREILCFSLSATSFIKPVP